MFSKPSGDDDEQEDYAHMGGWRQRVVVRSGMFLSRALLFVIGFYWIPENSQVNLWLCMLFYVCFRALYE